jgi:hypothetical protein
MWIARLLYAVGLALLPRHWRPARLPDEFTPWVPAAILSGMAEAILAVIGLVYWYSHTVTRWAAGALDSGLNNGPTADIDPHVLGLTAFAVWCLHPLTWLVAGFFIEGLVRIVAAVASEQVLPLWPLGLADWIYAKYSRRPPEGDALHVPGGKEQLRSLIQSTSAAAKTIRLAEVADHLVESDDRGESILEIHSCRRKDEWHPPKVVRILDSYYRLESIANGPRPYPFVYRLRRLSAGVPGRNVLQYEPPVQPQENQCR